MGSYFYFYFLKDGPMTSFDIIGMPRANAETAGVTLRDTTLGTGNIDNTNEKNLIKNLGLPLSDTKFGSSLGVHATNNENTNGVKGNLQSLPYLNQMITGFFYKVQSGSNPY